MSARLKRVGAMQYLSSGLSKGHLAQLRVHAAADSVTLEVLRDSRRDAKAELSLTAARELQRALQGAADEGYRLQAEREARRKLPGALETAVDQVAQALAKEGL